MPLYEFTCTACGARFEEITAAGDACPACPACGSTATERLLSAPSPLKTGAFPFKPGPVHPMASKMAQGAASCGTGGCGSGGFS